MGDLFGWLVQTLLTWFERVIVLGYWLLSTWLQLHAVWMVIIAIAFTGLVYGGHILYTRHSKKVKRWRKEKQSSADKDPWA